MNPEELESLLRTAFPDANVTVEEMTGGGDHYRVAIVSERFRGRSTLEQHRMVYDAVGGRMTREIHALSIRTSAPP